MTNRNRISASVSCLQVPTLLFVAALICGQVMATGPQTRGNASREHLLTLTSSARPQGADPAFDCGWRKLALEHALVLQPGMPPPRHESLFDALQLQTLCNESSYAASSYAAAVRSKPPARRMLPKKNACYFFVDAKNGSDVGNDGSKSRPFATLPHAVSAVRNTGAETSCSIELRAGTHRLHETLMLDERDSGLTIEGYNGEDVVLSGARVLNNITWKPYKAVKNAYVSNVAHFGVDTLPALRLGEKRVTLARYPNANPELDLFPEGYITASDPGDGSEWRAPTFPPYNTKQSKVCDEHMQCGLSKNVTVPVSEKEWHGMYQNYTVGVGGACNVYEDNKSPWCSGDFYLQRQFPEMHTRHPSGLNITIKSWFPGLVNTPYKNSTGAIVHAWREGHWYTWMFEVGAELHTKEGSWFLFTAGGNQGGEGCNRAGEWFIENVFEELDAPNEYYFDSVAQKLYLVHNGTGAPKQQVEAPMLATLIQMQGKSPKKPLVGVTIRGITVTANRPTFMDPRGNPSGGDWALERTGAITMENTENVTISDSLFTRLDSNCISINGYNRHTLIADNEAVWLGQNFIAAWGRSDGNDGTAGIFPRYTRVTGNFVHEVGHIQKQSSFFFQAETAQTYIANNIVFNIARAAINFNDGFGGGNEIVHNLLFNTCRESSDHGAFNSWDRLPYLTDIRQPGKASTIPAVNDVHRNLIVANYAADGGCLDNDDGSSYYDIHHNFCVYGGHKSDFDGNSKRSFNNIYAYPSVYGTMCLNIGAQELPPKGYAESFFNNTCALPKAGGTYLQVPGNPKKDTQAFVDGLELGGNTIYVPGAAPHIVLADTGQSMSFSAFKALGVDPATTVKDEAAAKDILAWGKAVLQPSI